MPADLNAQKLREYACAGAETVLNELRAEIIAIERTFPELALQRRRRALGSCCGMESRGWCVIPGISVQASA